MKFATVIVLLVTALASSAQISAEEARKRMEERASARDSDELKKVRGELEQRNTDLTKQAYKLSQSEQQVSELRAKIAELEGKLAAAEKLAAAKPTATTAPATPAKEAAPKPVVVVGESIPVLKDSTRAIGTFGDMHVRLMDHGVSKVPLVHLRDRTESAKPLLWVKVRVTNQSKTKKLDYSTWRGQDFAVKRDFATATDNFGNVLKRIDFGFATEVANAVESRDSIYPGKSIDDVLVFERPVDGTTTIKIELPQKNIGAEGDPISIDLPIK